MADAARGVRQLVLIHGRDAAGQLVEPTDKPLVKIASEVLGDESGRRGYSYSGLCLTSLPHRKLADDQAWERTVGPLTLIIEPGRIKLGDDPARLLGVPHARRTRTAHFDLSPDSGGAHQQPRGEPWALHARVDGPHGPVCRGETAAALREQARRIATCTMRLSWQTGSEAGKRGGPTMMTNERIIKSGLFFHDTPKGDARQDSLFEDRVLLDADFFEQLRRHPVPLQDAAIHQLKDSSAALDIYVWLAFRLHHLERRTPIGWKDLYQQFGSGYRHLWAWKPKFRQALAEAVAAYPEARVDVEDSHILLHPSPPPVAKLVAG